LGVDLLHLLRWKFADDASRDSYATAAKAYVAAAKEFGVRNVAEARGFDSYASSLLMRSVKPAALPNPGEAIGDGSHDVQESAFRLYRPGQFVNVVDDPKASDGKAARMTGGHTQWAVQVSADRYPDMLGKGPWYAYVVARVDAKRATGTAFQFGRTTTPSREHRDDQALRPPATARITPRHAHQRAAPGMYFWVPRPARRRVDA
jgi:hypothetical protein